MKKKVDRIPIGGYFQNCRFWSPVFRRPDHQSDQARREVDSPGSVTLFVCKAAKHEVRKRHRISQNVFSEGKKVIKIPGCCV
jgi:hypothetical protein